LVLRTIFADMKAALVTAYGQPPRYTDIREPKRHGREQVMDVVAAGLHPRVRSQAAGSHYTSTDELPLVPGLDGVGRTANGELRYFVLPDTTLGSMAERTLVDPRRSIPLPADTDPVLMAAAMNPAMSSWIALTRRISFTPGSSVLVLGATGNAGRLALEVAAHLGASHVVAAARDASRLAGVASRRTSVVSLGDPEALGRAASKVDVVLDYVWGDATADAMRAIIPRRRDDAQPLTWIQLGSVAGLESPIPSAALRAARLSIIGSGQGSVPPEDIVAELPSLVAEIARGTFTVDARPVPLADVENAWAEAASTRERLVLVP
jgi:NADPH:quinone reductase-like Zn-dependent oxidoreductase